MKDGENVKHYRIRTLDEGGFYIARRISFKSLEEMILHYQNDADGLCTQLVQPAAVDDKPQTQGKEDVYYITKPKPTSTTPPVFSQNPRPLPHQYLVKTHVHYPTGI